MADEVSVPVRTSIRSLYLRVLASFDRLQACLDGAPLEVVEQLPKECLKDQLGYFRLWAGNNGAHRKGRISLDHKLRLALHVHDKVTEYLTDLETALYIAIKIVKNNGTSRPDTPASNSSVSSSDDSSSGSNFGPQDDLPTTTPLEYALEEIDLRIKCLMRLSVVLRQPAHRDYQRKLSLPENRMDHYIPFDVKYVEEKLEAIACNIGPSDVTAKDNLKNEKFRAPYWLTERLGKANTQRRQLLAYFRNHHDKIAKYVDAPALQTTKIVNEEPADHQNDDHDDAEAFGGLEVMSAHQAPTLNISMRTQTTVTTIHTVSRAIDSLETMEAMSEGGQTETSFGTNMSFNDSDQTKIEVPPPPKAAEPLGDRPFQCPFCMIMINPGSTRSWERHVFRDLKPYICTFKNCSSATHLYESRREWSNHEIQFHRRQYFCPPCSFTCSDRGDFEGHLQSQHPDLPLLESTIESYERAILAEQNCILCGKLCRAGQLAAHLGRHMQQLALFVLPKELDDQEAQSGNQGSAIPSAGRSSISTPDSEPSNCSPPIEFSGSKRLHDGNTGNEDEDGILKGSVMSSTFSPSLVRDPLYNNLAKNAGDALYSSEDCGPDEDADPQPSLYHQNTEMPEAPYFAITLTVRFKRGALALKGPRDALREDIDPGIYIRPDPFSPSLFFTEIGNVATILEILRPDSVIPYIFSVIPAAKSDEELARQVYRELEAMGTREGQLIPGVKCTVSLLDLDGVARHRIVFVASGSKRPENSASEIAVTHIFSEIIFKYYPRAIVFNGPSSILRQDIPSGLKVSKSSDNSAFRVNIRGAADLRGLIHDPLHSSRGIHIHLTHLSHTQNADPVSLHQELVAMGPLPSFSCTVISTDMSLPHVEDLLILLGPHRAAIPSNADWYHNPGTRSYKFEVSQLYYSCSTGNTAAAKDLLRDYSPLIRKHHGNVLPIHVVCQHDNIEILEAILNVERQYYDSVSTLDARTLDTGFTPLHCAASSGSFNSIKYLLAHGANPWLRCKIGETPLDTFRHLGKAHAEESTALQIEELLQAAMRDISEPRFSHFSASDSRTPIFVHTNSLQIQRHKELPVYQAVLKIQGDLSSEGLLHTWRPDQLEARRKLVRFSRNLDPESATISSHFQGVRPNETQPSENTIIISCVLWEERRETYFTRMDCIFLLQFLLGVKFTLEDRSRTRRNLEGFRPLSVSNETDEEFYKLLMSFPSPKPCQSKSDTKVFPWSLLLLVLKMIIDKYSLIWADEKTTQELTGRPSDIPQQETQDEVVDQSSQLVGLVISPPVALREAVDDDARDISIPETAAFNASSYRLNDHMYGCTQIHAICAQGNIADIKAILNRNKELVHAKDLTGYLPISDAARHGDLDVVKLLVEYGSKFDEQSIGNRETPLLLAVANGHINVVKYLLELGADPRKRDYRGRSLIDINNECWDTTWEDRQGLENILKAAIEHHQVSFVSIGDVDETNEHHNPSYTSASREYSARRMEDTTVGEPEPAGRASPEPFKDTRDEFTEAENLILTNVDHGIEVKDRLKNLEETDTDSPPSRSPSILPLQSASPPTEPVDSEYMAERVKRFVSRFLESMEYGTDMRPPPEDIIEHLFQRMRMDPPERFNDSKPRTPTEKWETIHMDWMNKFHTARHNRWKRRARNYQVINALCVQAMSRFITNIPVKSDHTTGINDGSTVTEEEDPTVLSFNPKLRQWCKVLKTKLTDEYVSKFLKHPNEIIPILEKLEKLYYPEDLPPDAYLRDINLLRCVEDFCAHILGEKAAHAWIEIRKIQMAMRGLQLPVTKEGIGSLKIKTYSSGRDIYIRAEDPRDFVRPTYIL